jgi:Bacterial nucleoid DNA-binding protein
MNNKITLQDIIESLIQKHSMERKDAESFVKGMFELIENALATEKFVKIKGLGTFKLVDVDSRESINVNTGERFEIQGHSKVSFVPDPTLKNIINKPFAHFETVVLNEGTKLEDTDTVFENPANMVSDESSEEIGDNEIEIETESAGSNGHENVDATEHIIVESIDSEIDKNTEKETVESETVNSAEPETPIGTESEIIENAIVSENDNNADSTDVSEIENVNEIHNEIVDDKTETNENIEDGSSSEIASSEIASKEDNAELPNSGNENEETVNEEKLNISENDSSI